MSVYRSNGGLEIRVVGRVWRGPDPLQACHGLIAENLPKDAKILVLPDKVFVTVDTGKNRGWFVEIPVGSVLATDDEGRYHVMTASAFDWLFYPATWAGGESDGEPGDTEAGTEDAPAGPEYVETEWTADLANSVELLESVIVGSCGVQIDLSEDERQAMMKVYRAFLRLLYLGQNGAGRNG